MRAEELIYAVELTLEDGSWLVAVPDVPAVATYGRTIDDAVAAAREAIALVLEVQAGDDVDIDIDPSSLDIEVRYRFGDDDLDAVVMGALELRLLATQLAELQQVLAGTAAAALTAMGLSRRETGRVLELSHQRVQQIVTNPSPHVTKASEASDWLKFLDRDLPLPTKNGKARPTTGQRSDTTSVFASMSAAVSAATQWVQQEGAEAVAPQGLVRATKTRSASISSAGPT